MKINKQSSENKEIQVNKAWKTKERLETIQTKARKGLTAALIGLSLTWGLSSCENRSTDTTKEKIEQVTPKKELSTAELKKKPIDLGYEEINKENKINFISFPKFNTVKNISRRENSKMLKTKTHHRCSWRKIWTPQEHSIGNDGTRMSRRPDFT